MPSCTRHLQDTSSLVDTAQKSNRIANQPLRPRRNQLQLQYDNLQLCMDRWYVLHVMFAYLTNLTNKRIGLRIYKYREIGR